MVKCPTLFDSVRAKSATFTPDVYEVRMLNRIDNVKTNRLDATGKPTTKAVTREVSRWTNKLVAYYCPWSGDKAWSIRLGNDADYFFTATLNGCSVAVEGGATPRVTHANWVDTNAVTDQVTIDAEISRRHAGAHSVVRKTDYTKVAKKSAALGSGCVSDYLSTVIGFRKPTGWEFYYQSYKKYQEMQHAKTLNHCVLRDRSVKLI